MAVSGCAGWSRLVQVQCFLDWAVCGVSLANHHGSAAACLLAAGLWHQNISNTLNALCITFRAVWRHHRGLRQKDSGRSPPHGGDTEGLETQPHLLAFHSEIISWRVPFAFPSRRTPCFVPRAAASDSRLVFALFFLSFLRNKQVSRFAASTLRASART